MKRRGAVDRSIYALEQLRCALVNCENIRKGGSVFIEITKMNIQTAIDIIEKKSNG